MKIMLVVSMLQGGGAERVAVTLANEFVFKGHHVIFATDKTRSDEPFVYPLEYSVKVVKCFCYAPTSNIFLLWLKRYMNLIYKIFRAIHRYTKQYIRLRQTIVKEQPDVILGILHAGSFPALIASIGTNSIAISSERNAFERPLTAPMSRTDRFFKFTVNKLYKAVTVLTEADKNYIGNRLKNVYVMPNPLSFDAIDNRKLAEKRKKQIVAAGRIYAWHVKGFDNLIRAWGKIADDCEGWVLNIAGKGSESSLNYLKQLAKECRVEDTVVFSGFHSDMKSFYQESEIFVLSSRYEGFGMVLLEAMSQGCACIACDYGGRQREIIRSDKEGCCIDPDNVEQLSDAIHRMVMDDAYRQSVRYHGVLRSQAYSTSNITDLWLNLFEKIKYPIRNNESYSKYPNE